MNPGKRLPFALLFFSATGCFQVHVTSINPGIVPLTLQPGQQVIANARLQCDDCFLPILSSTCDCSSWAYRQLSWSSSNPDIATVADGIKNAGTGDRSFARVTGLRDGNAILTLKAGKATSRLSVQVVTLRSLQLEPAELHLQSGELTWLRVVATSANGERLQFPVAETWTTSDPEVLRMELTTGPSSSNNTFKALNLGEVIVTATAGALSTTAHVTVGVDHRIALFGPERLSVGEKSELVAWMALGDGGHPEMAKLPPDYPGRLKLAGSNILSWSVSGESIALSPRPGPNGERDSGAIRINAKRRGKSVVTATTVDGHRASQDVLVE